MTASLAEVLAPLGDLLMVAIAVFLRIGAAIALLPGLGEQLLPRRVRLGLAVCLAAVVVPAVASDVRAALPQGNLPPVWLISESTTGLALGAVLRLALLAMVMAGTMMAQATSLSQMLGGVAGEPAPAVVNLLQLGALALAMVWGLPQQIVAALILSFDAVPAGSFIPAALASGWGIGHVGRAFATAFSLAAPIMLVALLYNVSLGVMNRAMPQLMVSMIGAPVLAAGGLIGLALFAPLALSWWLSGLSDLLADPFMVPK